jgi:DNA invertase Pin-like site-specific DNA recombinase
MINIRGAFAEYERGKTRLRTLSGRREKARKGLAVGSTVPPFGYVFVRDAAGKTTTLELNPGTAPPRSA